jgi:hypothetical protein
MSYTPIFQIEQFPREFINYSKEIDLSQVKNIRYTIRLVQYDRVHGVNREIVKEWPLLTLSLVSKYAWFFRQVAARHQVEYPRKILIIEMYKTTSFSDAAADEVKTLKNKISSAKAKLTIYEKELKKLQENWTELFSIEQHPKYTKTVEYIKDKQASLKSLEFQLSTLVSAQNKNV